MTIIFPLRTRVEPQALMHLTCAWYPKHPLKNGCFSWMIPNLYLGNGCFTKHPSKNGCLGFQVEHYISSNFIPKAKGLCLKSHLPQNSNVKYVVLSLGMHCKNLLFHIISILQGVCHQMTHTHMIYSKKKTKNKLSNEKTLVICCV